MQHSATVPVLPTHDAQDAKASEESSDKAARKSMKRSTTIAATVRRANLGPDALEFLAAIRAKLNERHGNVLRGWLKEFDKEGMLTCTFRQLCAGASSLGLHHDVVLFLHGLSFADLDERLCTVMEHARIWVKETFGGPDAFLTALKKQGSGKGSFQALDALCKSYEFIDAFSSELKRLFDGLDLSQRNSLKVNEVLYLELVPEERRLLVLDCDRRHAEEQKQVLAELNADVAKRNLSDAHRLCQRAWHADVGLTAKIAQQRARQKRDESRARTNRALTAFSEHIQSVYGHEVRAWRRVFDPAGSFQLTRIDLRRYLCTIFFAADFDALWEALDRDGNGTISLEEMVPNVAVDLTSFRAWLCKEHGSCALAWESDAFRKARNGPKRMLGSRKLELAEFESTLRVLCYPRIEEPGHLRRLLQSLDLHGCGFITRTDLEWLDSWLPPQWLLVEPCQNALSKVRAALLREYGDMLAAWHFALSNSVNKVSWVPFQDLCKRLRCGSSAPSAWRALDKHFMSFLTLRDIDEDSHALIGSFKQWSDEHFGSVAHLMDLAAQSEPNCGMLTYSKIQFLCRKHGWPGDLRRLYKGLGLDGGRRHGTSLSILKSQIEFMDSWEESKQDSSTKRQLGCRAKEHPNAKVEQEGKETEASGSAPAVPRGPSKEGGSKSLPMLPPCHDPYASISPRRREQQMLWQYSVKRRRMRRRLHREAGRANLSKTATNAPEGAVSDGELPKLRSETE